MQNKLVHTKRLFSFHQWSRKPYAAFNSLKLLIKISVLSAVYSLVNPVQECKAQTDSVDISKKIDLEEVEVSGQRAPVVYSQIARTITVITRKEVEQAPVQSINELLENVPQVDIRQRGTNGVQADISIQGGSFDQTLILLNGINLTDPQTGHHNLNLPIDIESIDRIEILKGPASRVFGTNAFSGAVNFVTGENRKDYIKASLSSGDYGLYHGAFTVNKHLGKISNLISISKSKCDGYIQNTDYSMMNIFYHGNAQINRSKLHLMFGYNEKQFGANDFYSAQYPDQRESTSTWLTGLKFETSRIVKFTPIVYWRRNFDHFKIKVGDIYYHNYHFTDVIGGGLNSIYQNKIGKLAIGVDYRKEIVYSTKLGKSLSENDYIKVKGKDGLFYTKNDSRENYSLYVEQSAQFRNFNSTFGVMGNKNSKLGGVDFYPGMDMSYKLNYAIKLYSSVNRSLRLPSFTELYYEGPQNIGNVNLKPEMAWTLELGAKSQFLGLQTSLSGFYRWGKDIIDWIMLVGEPKWHTENFTELNTKGFEANILIPSEIFKSGLPFIKSAGFSYSYTQITKLSGDFNSYYALDNLRDKFTCKLTHSIIDKFMALWSVSYQDRNGTYGKWDITSQSNTETTYKGFWGVDGKISLTQEFTSVFIECTNIFNTDYIDFGNLSQPGRWFRAGFQVTL